MLSFEPFSRRARKHDIKTPVMRIAKGVRASVIDIDSLGQSSMLANLESRLFMY